MKLIKYRYNLITIATILVLFGLGIGFVQPVQAISDTYTVHNVKVSAKAKSAVAAQEIALADGKMKAFHMLMSKLAGYEDIPEIDDISREKIEDFILDYEVTAQKNSAVSYSATLNFRFDEAAVKNFMLSRQVKVHDSTQDSLVVVPVFIDQSAEKLWQADNPWLIAWSREKNFRSPHPLIIPIGDLNDISDLNAEQAVSVDVTALHKIARRYGAGGTLVLVAKQEANDLHIDMTLTTLSGTLQQHSFTVPAGTNSQTTSAQPTWAKAVAQAVTTLNGMGRETVAEDHLQSATSSTQQTLNIMVPLQGLHTWTQVQKMLQNVGRPIRNTQLKSMSSQAATIELTFSGSLPALESALAAQGLHLSQGSENQWILAQSQYTNPSQS